MEFEAEFKVKLVKEVLGGRKLTEVATEYQVDYTTLCSWKEEFLTAGSQVLAQGVEEQEIGTKKLTECRKCGREILLESCDLLVNYNQEGICLNIWSEDKSKLALSKEQQVGRNVREILPSELADRFLFYIDQALATNQVQTFEYSLDILEKEAAFEVQFIAKSSKEVVAVIRDITERKKLREKLRRNKGKIRELYKATSKMRNCQKQEEICQLAVKAAENILDFNDCLISFNTEGKFVIKAASFDIMNAKYCNLPFKEGVLGETFKTDQVHLIDDVLNKEKMISIKGYRSVISIPMDGFGVFQAISRKVGAFNQEDLQMAELLILHTKAALNRIRSQEEIRYRTFHDSLTDVYNRTYINEKLKEYDVPEKLPLSIIIGDVNGLKLVNDAFGHQLGDKLLTKVAEIIKASSQPQDIVARWGGDEFMVLLPQTGKGMAQRICAEIKDACNEIKIDNLIRPSISLGYEVKEKQEQDLQEVFQQAEDYMYKNKLNESNSIHNKILSSLRNTLRETTHETEAHVKELKRLSLKLGKSLQLTDVQLADLSLLAELHDLGEVATCKRLIHKPTPLTTEEWEEVKNHAEVGYQIASSSTELSSIAEGILSHHEWWDGSGYPQGISEEEIPLISRIIAIVDAYDVMTTGRPYQDPVTKEEALDELKRAAGTQFDPELMKKFIQLMEE